VENILFVVPVKISEVRRHLEYYQYVEQEEEYYRQQEKMLIREQTRAQEQEQQSAAGKSSQKDEMKQAADEATKAAQEAAKAAAEASQGLMKGISSLGGNLMEQSGGFGFGFGGGSSNKKGGFSLGGFGLGSLGAATQPAKKVEPVVAKPKQPVIDEKLYPKPYTAHMTAQERWWWAYRMTVQVTPRNIDLD